MRSAVRAPTVGERHGREAEGERERPVDVTEPRVHDRAGHGERGRRARATSRAHAAPACASTCMNSGASRKPPLLPRRPETNPTAPATAMTSHDACARARCVVDLVVRARRAARAAPSTSTSTSVASTSEPPGIHCVRSAPTTIVGRPTDEPDAQHTPVDVAGRGRSCGRRATSTGSSRAAATRGRPSPGRRSRGAAASRRPSRPCRTAPETKPMPAPISITPSSRSEAHASIVGSAAPIGASRGTYQISIGFAYGAAPGRVRARRHRPGQLHGRRATRWAWRSRRCRRGVRRLEAELGVRLFDRVGRRVELTDAGHAFEGPARRLVRERALVLEAVGSVRALDTGTLDLVSLPTLAVDPLAPLVGRFRVAHPGVVVHIAEPEDAAGVEARVADGRSELGLAVLPAAPRRSRHDRARPPGDRRGVPARHTLARSGRLPRRAARRHAASSRHRPGRRCAISSTRRSRPPGSSAEIAVETGQREAIAPLVLRGRGNVVPAAPDGGGARGRRGSSSPGSTPPLVRTIGLLHRASPLTPAARAFVELARKKPRSADPVDGRTRGTSSSARRSSSQS